MGFRRSGLQEAFFVPGDQAFRVWGYSTADALEEVLRPGYFLAQDLVQPGELVYARMQAQPPARLRRPEPLPVHMALLMVVSAGARAGPPAGCAAQAQARPPGRQPQQEGAGAQRARRRARAAGRRAAGRPGRWRSGVRAGMKRAKPQRGSPGAAGRISGISGQGPNLRRPSS